MLVRKAITKDIPRILELLKQVNKVHADLRPDLFVYTTKYNHDELAKMLLDDSKPIFVCVDDNDVVLGYGMCVLEDYSNVDLRTNIKSIYIDDICVDEQFRKQGVGNEIYQHIVKFAREMGCYNITLNVWKGNDSAQRFYEGLGMIPLKTTMEQIL